MKKYTHNLIRIGAMLLVALGVVGPAGFAAVVPVQAASFFPGVVCESGTCDLWAKSGTLTMPDGAVIPIWGFAPDAGSPATLPGPTLIANAGDTVNVVLHNTLAGETVSLDFLGVPLVPDLTGVPSGGTRTYTLTLDNPGTFLYQAGLTNNGPRQVSMGLFGAVVVRPAGQPLQAYDDSATAFTDEALLVFSEIDPAFNANPNTFLLEDFSPRYWLINGKSFPQTDQYTFDAGRRVLFRYINAGFDHHSIGLLGLRETVLAKDAAPQLSPLTVNTEIMGAGQTMDVLVGIPAGAVTGKKYLLYETSLIQHNANQRLVPGGPVAVGGMMTTITVGVGAPSPLVGPLVADPRVTPSPTTGAQGVTLYASLVPGGVGMEYFIDVLGPPGTGIGVISHPVFLPFMVSSSSGGGSTPPPPAPDPGTLLVGTSFSFVIPESVLAALPGGYHTFYIRGVDASGNWGPVSSVVLNLDKVGPDIVGMELTSSPTNGQVDVALRATADELHNGNAVVNGATYAIDGGAPQPLLLAKPDQPIVALTATIPAADILALSEGTHTVSIQATDSMGNVGAPGTITLIVDKTGPLTDPIITVPPDFQVLETPTVIQVQIQTTIVDGGTFPTSLVTAEGFIRGVGEPGTGFEVFATDGQFNEPSEEVFFDISTVNFPWWGVYTVSIRGKDAAGNWGPATLLRILPPGSVYQLNLPAISR